MDGELTSAIRISFGAMSATDDLLVFAKFLEKFRLDLEPISSLTLREPVRKPKAVVESLTIVMF